MFSHNKKSYVSLCLHFSAKIKGSNSSCTKQYEISHKRHKFTNHSGKTLPHLKIAAAVRAMFRKGAQKYLLTSIKRVRTTLTDLSTLVCVVVGGLFTTFKHCNRRLIFHENTQKKTFFKLRFRKYQNTKF